MSEGANGGGWEKYRYRLNWPWFVSRIQLHCVSGRCIQVGSSLSWGNYRYLLAELFKKLKHLGSHILRVSTAMAYKERLYKHFCMGERWERCPAEKLQVWGTTAPDTPLFLLGSNSHRQLGTTLVFQDLWNANMALFASWPFTQNICSSINKKKTLHLSNFFYPWFILSGKWGHISMSPWHSMAVVVMFGNFWLVSSGSWCYCPLSCFLSGKVNPAWDWETYTGENFGQSEAGEKWGLLQHWNPEFQPSWVGSHRRAAGDAALISRREQKAFLHSDHEPWVMTTWFNFLKESSGKAKDFDPTPSWKNTLENCWLW